MDKLKKVVLDVENGVISVNGVVLPKISYFKLEFAKARWRLSMNEDLFAKVDLTDRIDKDNTATVKEQQFYGRGKKIVPNE